MRVKRRLAAAVVLALAASAPAYADEPVNWADPSYPGSLTDARAVVALALNDATAVGAGVAPTQGCISTATVPMVRADSESYTRAAVFSRVGLYTNAFCSDVWVMQYFHSGANEWRTIGATSMSGSNNAYYVGEVTGSCIAGTWLYRVAADNWHTDAVRYTCTDPNEPFRIDS